MTCQENDFSFSPQRPLEHFVFCVQEVVVVLVRSTALFLRRFNSYINVVHRPLPK